MSSRGKDYDRRVTELRAAIGELIAAADSESWDRGPRHRWSAGQHVDHVVNVLDDSARAFEDAAERLRSASLAARPRRGPLQALWVMLLAGAGVMPRGGRTPKRFEAGSAPERTATLARLQSAAERLRAVGLALDEAARDRLWIPNPFLPRWQYGYMEMIRVQAVHARHHAGLAREAARAQRR